MKTYKKRLYRSLDDKVVFGIMGGLGEYFDVDPVILRAGYTAFSFFTGVFPGVLAYIIMAIIIPKENKINSENV
jgi:phage shock protein C